MRRSLTAGEHTLAASVFGDAIDYDRAAIALAKWAFFQPRDTVMAPCGCIHFHPEGTSYRDDFAAAPLTLQGLFVHEMTHVWQAQRSGRYFLPLMRHPFCRYDYVLEPGKGFDRYGIEQQAEIVRHAFLLRRGVAVPGAASRTRYELLLPFSPAR